MKNKITYLLLGVILILATILRIYQIGNVPASPDWDEVALGYNAYSIMQTGKDEYGKFLPVVLESFDDYKPALYAYLIIPFISVFDLTVVAVRLPGVIFGILSVLGVFLVSKNLFQDGITYRKHKINVNILSLVIALFFAISPWHIQFSRVAFEAQVGLSLNIYAILFFIKALKNKLFLPLSFSLAAISIYVYQSEKVYIPLLFLLLFASFYRQFFKTPKRWIVFSLSVAVLVVLPMLFYILTNPNSLNRAKGVSVFSDTTKLLSDNTEKLSRNRERGNNLGLVFDNRRIEYGKAFIAGYLSHFEPNWLFYRGDSLRHQPPYMGLLYIFELPFILIGLYVLLFSGIPRHIKFFIVGYVLISPIPASITIDVPHAVRTINMLPAPQIFSGIGIVYFFYRLSHIKPIFKYLMYFIFIAIVSFNVLYYFSQYFIQMNYYYSKAWQYGWEEAVGYTLKHESQFEKIVVTNVSPLDQSYMFYLFYMKYDPRKYQEAGGTKSGGFADEHTAFEKFEFRPINWEVDKGLKNTLFVGRSEDLPDNRGMIVNYLNGEPAIVFSEKHE